MNSNQVNSEAERKAAERLELRAKMAALKSFIASQTASQNQTLVPDQQQQQQQPQQPQPQQQPQQPQKQQEVMRPDLDDTRVPSKRVSLNDSSQQQPAKMYIATLSSEDDSHQTQQAQQTQQTQQTQQSHSVEFVRTARGTLIRKDALEEHQREKARRLELQQKLIADGYARMKQNGKSIPNNSSTQSASVLTSTQTTSPQVPSQTAPSTVPSVHNGTSGNYSAALTTQKTAAQHRHSKQPDKRTASKYLLPCEYLGRNGECRRGPRCQYVHDPSRITVCPYYLRGQCQRGANCALSHDATPERTPHCKHFQNGDCSKSECLYIHVKVSDSAPVCANYGRYGYCEKGSKCMEKHVVECPDYANTGKCSVKKCKLPHITRKTNIARTPGSTASELVSPWGAAGGRTSATSTTKSEVVYIPVDDDPMLKEIIHQELAKISSNSNTPATVESDNGTTATATPTAAAEVKKTQTDEGMIRFDFTDNDDSSDENGDSDGGSNSSSSSVDAGDGSETQQAPRRYFD